MMRKGFTLLELVVVIIILGVLATLGITQYGRMVERARGAEARMIIGDMRKLAFAYWLANGTITGMTNANLNIGAGADQIPAYPTCDSAHYFSYLVQANANPQVADLVAYRCTSGGKNPQYVGSAAYLEPYSNLVTGSDTWNTNVGY